MVNIPLSDDAIIELAREGGIAFIPGLRAERRIALAQLSEPQKKHVCSVLEQAMARGKPEEEAPRIGGGDQRYFRIQITYSTQHNAGSIVILIPEAEAPPELQSLWKEGN
ncbi:hypothetical protein LU196_03860 [Pantoea sp. Mb-10]|nr:hypothetical protein [Pantoea sp. Mb-10]MCE0503059.1 hypothetical protein [Pantoea sp. Pb-8]